MRILLVEDNPGDARLVQEILKEVRGNFTISVAEKLELGLKLLLSQDVDVVLMDLNLPDSRGLATLTKLQAGFSHLPIVIMTSIDDEELAQQAVRLGAQDYLVKGNVNGELLRRTLIYAIERKQAEEDLRRAHDELEIRVQERTKELNEANKSIKTERQRFYDVLEMLPVYVVLLTPDYHVPFANRFFRERFGESGGKCCYEYLFNRTEPCPICETYTVLKTNSPHHWEWTGPDGRNYDIYDYPFVDADGSTLILEMGIDITERKQAQKALREINQTLEQRVAGRTAELLAANETLRASRLASLNLMEDALAARRQAEETSAVLRDEIAERKRAEAALKESEARFRTLFETMTEGFSLDEIILDDAGKPVDLRYLSVNPSFERHTGLKAQDIVGRTTRELFPEAEPVWFERYGKVALTGEPVHFEERFGPLDKWFEVSVYRTEPGRFAVVFFDITEHKKNEQEILKLSEDMAARNTELEALNKDLESFAYSISHDLRAPLRSIAGFVKIVTEDYPDKLDAQGKDYLARIRKGSERMSQLIDDLLRLSKISRQDVDLLSMDLGKLAESAVLNLRESAPGRTVEIVIAEGVRALVDPNLMRVALMNLLDNAWKFTSKVEKARIEFGIFERDGKTIYFVKDNGVGFDPQFSERMFMPFHRLHTDKEFEGSGIGLAIVERVIRRHGGKVWAEGEVGKGATVYFTLG